MSFGSSRIRAPTGSARSQPQDGFTKVQALVETVQGLLREIDDGLHVQDGSSILDRLPGLQSTHEEAKRTARTFDAAVRELTKEVEYGDVRQRQMLRYRVDKMRALTKATKDDVNKMTRKLHEAKINGGKEKLVNKTVDFAPTELQAVVEPGAKYHSEDPEVTTSAVEAEYSGDDGYRYAGVSEQEQLERYGGMEHIQGQVSEVNAIFKDLAGIVTTQGEMISTVEENTCHAADKAEQGKQELEKMSSKYGISHSAIVLLLLAICLLGILFHSTGGHTLNLNVSSTIMKSSAATPLPSATTPPGSTAMVKPSAPAGTLNLAVGDQTAASLVRRKKSEGPGSTVIKKYENGRSKEADIATAAPAKSINAAKGADSTQKAPALVEFKEDAIATAAPANVVNAAKGTDSAQKTPTVVEVKDTAAVTTAPTNVINAAKVGDSAEKTPSLVELKDIRRAQVDGTGVMENGPKGRAQIDGIGVTENVQMDKHT